MCMYISTNLLHAIVLCLRLYTANFVDLSMSFTSKIGATGSAVFYYYTPLGALCFQPVVLMKLAYTYTLYMHTHMHRNESGYC